MGNEPKETILGNSRLRQLFPTYKNFKDELTAKLGTLEALLDSLERNKGEIHEYTDHDNSSGS